LLTLAHLQGFDGPRGLQLDLMRVAVVGRQAIQWLEQRLTARGSTLAMVTHDRAFMEATCTGILELDSDGAHLHSFGGPGSYARFRQVCLSVIIRCKC